MFFQVIHLLCQIFSVGFFFPTMLKHVNLFHFFLGDLPPIALRPPLQSGWVTVKLSCTAVILRIASLLNCFLLLGFLLLGPRIFFSLVYSPYLLQPSFQQALRKESALIYPYTWCMVWSSNFKGLLHYLLFSGIERSYGILILIILFVTCFVTLKAFF